MDTRLALGETIAFETEELLKASKKFDMEQVYAVTNLLIACGRSMVFTAGAGTSGAVARKVAHTLNCVGRASTFLDPIDAAHGGSGVVRKGDVVLFFSKGGQTDELLSIAPVLVERRAKLILVTEKEHSELASRCDVVLKMPPVCEAGKNNCIATTSILLILILFDAISISIMKETNYAIEEFAKTHPGGAVGIRFGVSGKGREVRK